MANAVLALEVIDGELVYLPCSVVNIDGDVSPDSYIYRVGFSTPDSRDSSRTGIAGKSGLCMFRYGTSATLYPMAGLESPLRLSSSVIILPLES